MEASDHIVIWYYEDDVTFVIAGSHAFVFTNTEFKQWGHKSYGAHTIHREFLRFIVESLEKSDREFKALKTLSACEARPERSSSEVRIVYDGKPEDLMQLGH